MKRLWGAALGLSLGCWLTGARGGEGDWRPARATNSAGVTLGRPIAAAADSVSLGSPASPDSSPIILASFSDTMGTQPSTIFRGQGADPLTEFADDRPIQTLVATRPASIHPVPSTAALPNCDSADCCDNLCCDDKHAHGGQLYGSAEYLLWWISPAPSPALVSTGPATLPFSQQAIPGIDGNSVLYGGPIYENTFSGGRFTLGYWFDPCQTCAIDGRFFFLGGKSTRFEAGSPEFQVLGRPFFDQNFNQPGAELTVSPTIGSGQINVSSSSELWGAEANLRKNVCCGCWGRFDLFSGFRYLDLRENLTISEQVLALQNSMMGSSIPPGSSVFNYDSFRTRNQFYGGQLGGELELRRNRWFTDLRAAVALGDNHETIDVNGSETVIPPGGTPQVSPGGLLALPSNIGHFTQDRLAVVPELGINVGYQFTENLRVFVGYTAIYWSSVVRPGDQIDTTLDIRQIPNLPPGPIPPVSPSRPLIPFKQTDFWAQGVNFGIELRY